MKMKVLRRIPRRLPKEPVLIHECDGGYAIWTGRSWFGSVNRMLPRGWQVITPGTAPEVFETFKGAMLDAEFRANYAEGRVS